MDQVVMRVRGNGRCAPTSARNRMIAGTASSHQVNSSAGPTADQPVTPIKTSPSAALSSGTGGVWMLVINVRFGEACHGRSLCHQRVDVAPRFLERGELLAGQCPSGWDSNALRVHLAAVPDDLVVQVWPG